MLIFGRLIAHQPSKLLALLCHHHHPVPFRESQESFKGKPALITAASTWHRQGSLIDQISITNSLFPIHQMWQYIEKMFKGARLQTTVARVLRKSELEEQENQIPSSSLASIIQGQKWEGENYKKEASLMGM